MTLHMKKQFEAMHAVPNENRIAHWDGSGCMVKILKKFHDYPQLLTYGIVIQDLEHLSESRYLLASETTTSSHDTHSLSSQLLRFRTTFMSLYKKEKRICKMFAQDMSWAGWHAACDILNRESIIEFQDRMFELAKGDTTVCPDHIVLLVSCGSHTANRVSRAIKKHKIFKASETENKNFSLHCFSLMMNSVDLETHSQIFELMCLTFLSNNWTPECENAKKSLEKLIELRPQLEIEIKKIIQEAETPPLPTSTEEDEEDANEGEIERPKIDKVTAAEPEHAKLPNGFIEV